MASGDTKLARNIAGKVLAAAVYAVTIALALYVTRIYFDYPQTDDAYVRANIVGIAPHISGPLVDLPIRDNQRVRKGDLLFIIDPRPYQAELDSTIANLDLTNLEIDALDNTISAAKAKETQLEADRAYDQQYLARIEPLLSENFVTANEVSSAKAKLAAARAAVENAKSEVARATNELGKYGDINARRKAAEAAAYRARLNVEYCHVKAPFDGYVTNLNIAIGQYANEGKQVVSLVDDRNWYVLANFRETFLARIQPGMDAEVFLLGYPNVRFRGRVEGVGWALFQENGASVEGLPRVEPTLNWVRLAQRFPVRVTLEDRDARYPFRMGETAVVTIKGYP
ncbi:MAG: rane fusion protein multidrug efflux system [Candidatus Binataceae bacterium]|jgi:multidrug efflux system membrane fusion protein|nr:rane fusion protein multidrug efflux system [Candidatus Binataceae bacterium]